MGDSNLEERLKSHARAFEGLMSLIPAKEYYGKDASITSTQWSKKKQTKEERQAAKRAKLDPASHKTAKDVMDENARKRKRELEGEDSSDSSDVDIDMDIEKEKPLEGLKKASSKSKKQKTEEDSDVDADPHEQEDNVEQEEQDAPDAKAKAAADKRKQKLEKKKEKQAKKQQNKDAKKALKQEFGTALGNSNPGAAEEEDEEDAMDDNADEDIEALDVSGLVEDPQSTATSSVNSHASSASIASAASSSSSVLPTNEELMDKKDEKAFKYDPKKHEAFRDRLAQKLAAMRAARKADGPDGRPARNRAELIESRRKKEAERKAARKASRQLAKEDEERLKAEEQLARLRGGSGSPSLFSMRPTPEQEPAFNFGRVSWKDGQQLDSSLSGFLEAKKKKGKSDPKTALAAAEKKKQRISALDEAKRKDIEEKDMWLDAKKRAQGEKVHNDAALLKKSVKRQEKAKAKSKQEWKDRLTSVEKAKAAKQKKREENLKQRREEKGKKGKKGTKAKKPGKKVKRPGFEGTFKAR